MTGKDRIIWSNVPGAAVWIGCESGQGRREAL
jgi:hypothetical protein